MIKIKEGFSNYINGFVKGDLKTRLSYFIMGASNFLNKQFVRGITFLSVQIFSLFYFLTYGIKQIAGLRTLGTQLQGKVFDEDRGIYVYTEGDNSMLMLLLGVIAIVILLGVLGIYYLNVKNAHENKRLNDAGKKLPTFKDDVHSLLDNKFHITVLSLPTILTFAFTVLPLIFTILIAFTNFDRNHQPPGNLFTWVGLTNFKNMFYGNPLISNTFFKMLGWTFTWAFFATFANYILGMLLAILINSKQIKIKKFWRTLFVITIAVPQFVSLLLMAQMLGDHGALNVILRNIGLIGANDSIKFLTDGNIARITVIIVNCWVGIPYSMLITSGILMNIPKDMYESADIDGATGFVKFTKITLPYMLNVTAPYLITQFVGNLNNFNVIYLLTGGGPLTLDYYNGGKTDLLVTWLYKLTVNQNDYALAATLGIIIFAISATLSLVIFNRVLNKMEGEFK